MDESRGSQGVATIIHNAEESGKASVGISGSDNTTCFIRGNVSVGACLGHDGPPSKK